MTNKDSQEIWNFKKDEVNYFLKNIKKFTIDIYGHSFKDEKPFIVRKKKKKFIYSIWYLK
jgi:hypothetical protein